MSTTKPHFVIKNRFQKRSELYQDILTSDILSDVCYKITGNRDYSVEFDNEGYNKGRMAKLECNGTTSYISFSETKVEGRNSSFQSVSSALLSYYQEKSPKRRLYFYFLPSIGNIDTNYFNFMYRLMLTAGFEFLNADCYLSREVKHFNTVDDVIAARNGNRTRNRSNNSSYVTRGQNHVIQIYGKTYGASKYETTLLCIALSRLSAAQIELYEICEQDLSILPERSLAVIESLGKVRIIPTNLTMERGEFERDDSLRSPRYIYNLLAKLGPKKCALCDCEIPELIAGAHIWPVAEIKLQAGISMDDKIKFATDGDNGIWLCENHHKMLDEDIITIDMAGTIKQGQDIEAINMEFINWSTPNKQLSSHILTADFLLYLKRRYRIPA